MKNDYCDKCRNKRALCHVTTESPTGSFSKSFWICIPCVKDVEALIEGKKIPVSLVNPSLDEALNMGSGVYKP